MRIGRPVGIFAIILSVISGCAERPAASFVVEGMNINGYDLEYEFTPPGSIQVDANSFTINTGKKTIAVADGKLRVDGRSYGAVKPKNRISTIGDKVKVNGEVRKPDTPN